MKRHQASVLSIDRLADSASLHCPLTFFDGQARPDYLRFARESLWEASAVQAAAVETLSLPSRLFPGQRGAMLMGEMEQSFGAEHALLRAEMSAEDARGDNRDALVNGHGSRGDDPRTRDRSPTPPDEQLPSTAPLDFHFLPSFSVSSVRPKTFATVDVLRGDDRAPQILPGTRENPDDVARTWLPTRLQLPRPNSYPAVFSFGDASSPDPAPSRAGSFGVGVGVGSGEDDGTDLGGRRAPRAEESGMAGGLRMRARLVADTGVAGWVRWSSLKARLLDSSMREAVTERLLEVVDRYVGGEYGVEEEEDLDDEME